MTGPFDSHCHFDPGDDAPAIVARAREAGLCGILAVGCSAESNGCALAAAASAPGFVLAAAGFDPGCAGTVEPGRAAD
ncbi:MAG: TatD family hydrolase, partial [Kiritimatiellae bacterium]|nr:TatD family hydrolase [Kiritimatiellia bacterium]